MVLFFAMGVGTLALIVFFIGTLALIGLYGQFVWSFTQWDLASIQSDAVKPWAQFALVMVFGCGMLVGIWLFGGYAWKNVKARRANAATRRRR
jgi:hypothetical protein